jgi:NAD(P)H dehydrogenase (quinone)
MPRYAVTGVTGHFGRHVVEELLSRGVPADDVVGVARTPTKATGLVERGVQIREGDYSRPETLPAALAGVQRLLLVSGTEVGQRVAQHTAVIEAAAANGVQRIAYTSILRADRSTAPIAGEHRGTEEALRDPRRVRHRQGLGRPTRRVRRSGRNPLLAADAGDVVYELGGPGLADTIRDAMPA